MSEISRRHVAKGAAWAIPAVSVAASAPAVAASNPCTPVAASCLIPTRSSTPTYTSTRPARGVTKFNVTMGTYKLDQTSVCKPDGSGDWYFAVEILTVAVNTRDGRTLPGTINVNPKNQPGPATPGGSSSMTLNFDVVNYPSDCSGSAGVETAPTSFSYTYRIQLRNSAGNTINYSQNAGTCPANGQTFAATQPITGGQNRTCRVLLTNQGSMENLVAVAV